jgi:hypothetical protein
MSELRKPLNFSGCGERQGSATAVQLPTISGAMFLITALASNAGNVYLGGAGVTVPNGTTDVTSGLELTPGRIVTLSASNLNEFYIICDNAGDDITYLALG